MKIDLPISAKLSKVKINNNFKTSISEAINGKQIVTPLGFQRFSFDLEFTLHQDEIREFDLFMMKLKGRLNTFSLKIPYIYLVKDTLLRGLITAKATNAGASLINLSGIDSGTFYPADIIQLSSSDKLYMVESYSQSKGILSIIPRLITDSVDGDLVKYKDVKPTLRLKSDKYTKEYKNGHDIVNVRISAEEAF